MSQPIDLNRIRAIVHANQRNERANPRNPKATIVVDRDARIHTADELSPDKRRTVSRIQQDTFHASRVKREGGIAESFLPENTRRVTSAEGGTGWLYSFENDFLDSYTMFAFFDGSYYQVLVVSPVVEQRYRSPHTGHIFSSGKICMGQGMNSGRRTLQDAYAKSVLWATGFSAMLHGRLNRFPFNFNE